MGSRTSGSIKDIMARTRTRAYKKRSRMTVPLQLAEYVGGCGTEATEATEATDPILAPLPIVLRILE